MSIKRTVIEQSIKKAEKRIKHLKSLIYASPLSDILELRTEAANKSKECGTQEFMDWLSNAAKQEQKLKRLAKRQSKDQFKWMDEQAKLEFELSQLKTELWYLDRAEQRT